ncbi:MAG: NAD-dependent epimerase/dehydratase family protein [Bacteriovoracaceae bacterium]|nr:NAD-dependent epimerase/dehydratase family protein [Bacteriovoracaceae bacterium]
MNGSIRNANVCVIGGAGFLGSHLVDYLINELNCRVLVLDNLISGKEEHIHTKAEFINYDICEDVESLTDILKNFNTEYLFNYAAEPYVPDSFERPLHIFEINATAVLKVLSACKAAGVQAILQVSSAEIYGDVKGKINEDAYIEPHSTYGVSKVAADGICRVQWKESGVPVIILRQFNCVGERETHEYVIPEIISQLSQSNRVELGNNSFRDFQYAGDAVRMAVELLEKGQFGEVYNMGSEDGIQIYDLADKIGKIMGKESIEICQVSERVRPWEIWHLQSDNSKLYKAIETRPNVGLDEALKRTIDYFYANGENWAF